MPQPNSKLALKLALFKGGAKWPTATILYHKKYLLNTILEFSLKLMNVKVGKKIMCPQVYVNNKVMNYVPCGLKIYPCKGCIL